MRAKELRKPVKPPPPLAAVLLESMELLDRNEATLGVRKMPCSRLLMLRGPSGFRLKRAPAELPVSK